MTEPKIRDIHLEDIPTLDGLITAHNDDALTVTWNELKSHISIEEIAERLSKDRFMKKKDDRGSYKIW